MNLEKVFKLFQKEWSHLNFELQILTKEKLTFTNELVAEDYFDDGIYSEFIVYSSGTAHAMFTFDHLEENEENLKLINDFNSSTPFLKAYISKKGENKYLELHGVNLNSKGERDVVDSLSYFLRELLNDDVLELLQPLTARTYKK